jgi:hypothetical protein
LEQTVEVVRNDKGGPRTRCSDLVPKAGPLWKSWWERTTGTSSGGGAIFENPRRGRLYDPGRTHRPWPVSEERRERTTRTEHVFEGGVKVTRAVRFSLERLGSAVGSEPRRSVLRYEDHGGRAGKADDPQRFRTLVQPRWNLGFSCEVTGGPEGPMNSREAARVLRNDGTPARRARL